MTPITPTYAQAYQSLCLAGRLFVVPPPKVSLPRLPKPNTRIFLTPEPRHVKMATTSRDVPFAQMEVARVSEGETSAGWGAVARSLDGRLFVMCSPSHHNRSTSRVCRGWTPFQQHCTELLSIIEALSFLGPDGPLPRDSQA